MRIKATVTIEYDVDLIDYDFSVNDHLEEQILEFERILLAKHIDDIDLFTPFMVLASEIIDIKIGEKR